MKPQIKLSLTTCTVISALIEQSIQDGKEKLFSARMAMDLGSHEVFRNLLPKDILDRLPEAKEKLATWEGHIKDFEAALLELSESVQDFEKIHECGKEIMALTKKFKEAKAWSLEEKEAYLKVCKYSEENEEFISAAHDEILNEKSEYLRIWEEKNAGK